MIGNISANKGTQNGGNWWQRNSRQNYTWVAALVLFLLAAASPLFGSVGSASAATLPGASKAQVTSTPTNPGAKGSQQNPGQLQLGSVVANGNSNPAANPVPASSASASSCGPDWSLVDSANASTGISAFLDMDGVASNDVWAVGGYNSGINVVTQYNLAEHWNGTAWSNVPIPSGPGSAFNTLNGVAAVASNDVWAVGYYSDPGTSSYRTLTERWNGTTWNIVSSPNPNTNDAALTNVVAISTNDVWAFGYHTDNYRQTLAMHWDGSIWSILATPNIGTNNNELDGATVVPGSNGTDLWAVGYYTDVNNGNVLRTLAMRWSNSTWSIVTTPNVGSDSNRLSHVAAVSATDVWAVGYGMASGIQKTLAEHWDGNTWSIVTTPTIANKDTLLYDIAPVSATDIWATGYYQGGTTQALIEHWNGTAWSMVPANTPGLASILAGIVAISATDIWTGFYYATSTAAGLPLAEHYNGTTWGPVPAPVGPTNINILNAVAASSANSVWAVGYYQSVGLNPNYNQTLVERWNGASWSVVTSSNASTTTSNALQGVAMVPGNANDGWAVGSYIDPATSKARTLIERWNGTSWSTIPSPNANLDSNILSNVAVVSANDVWAVGNYTSGTVINTLTEHWNGTSWIVITSPNVAPGTDLNFLNDITVVPGTSGADIWAVGSAVGANAQTLIMKWDGASQVWNIVSSPNGPNNNGFLYAVTAIAANDVWAAGGSTGSGQNTTLAEHWDGGAWTVVSTVDFGSGGTNLSDMTAIATDDIYAVGSTHVGATDIGPVVEHWNGTAWSLVTSPNPSSTAALLFGVTAVSATDVWAVGYTLPSQAHTFQALTERFHTCPAACTLTFNDVPAGSTYYDYVRCLSCQSIVGGYNCGGVGEPCPGNYFRPNNSVTRGQAAKFIANAANYTDSIPNSQQTFADVAPASSFWLYVERVYQHGAISGYACGGAGEPCDAGNHPYFRPSANLTRGQLAKIATTAAGFNDVPAGQTFADVPAASPFYLYVERAHIHSIISGYACGGTGEPCPGTYFRPGLNVTRGQTSKIVSGTFFPNCEVQARK